MDFKVERVEEIFSAGVADGLTRKEMIATFLSTWAGSWDGSFLEDCFELIIPTERSIVDKYYNFWKELFGPDIHCGTSVTKSPDGNKDIMYLRGCKTKQIYKILLPYLTLDRTHSSQEA
jgi:hypothetical protein